MAYTQLTEQQALGLVLAQLADKGYRAQVVDMSYDVVLDDDQRTRIEVKGRRNGRRNFKFGRMRKRHRWFDIAIGVTLNGAGPPTFWIGTWREIRRDLQPGDWWRPHQRPRVYRERWDKLG